MSREKAGAEGRKDGGGGVSASQISVWGIQRAAACAGDAAAALAGSSL